MEKASPIPPSPSAPQSKVQPLEQWNIGREYRRRLKKAFDAQGIEIPFPNQTLYMAEASRPFKVEMVTGSSMATVWKPAEYDSK